MKIATHIQLTLLGLDHEVLPDLERLVEEIGGLTVAADLRVACYAARDTGLLLQAQLRRALRAARKEGEDAC